MTDPPASEPPADPLVEATSPPDPAAAPDDPGAAGAGPAGPSPDGVEAPAEDMTSDVSAEALLGDVERLTAERDDLRDRLLRTQAEFDNYRKRAARERDEAASSGASRLAEDLLPVLDACDGALSHGESAVEPIFAALLASLEKGGLERIDPLGEGFDPNLHEAVVHEPAEEGDEAGEVVVEVMRRGYVWNGRVLRAAMVKVRG